MKSTWLWGRELTERVVMVMWRLKQRRGQKQTWQTVDALNRASHEKHSYRLAILLLIKVFPHSLAHWIITISPYGRKQIFLVLLKEGLTCTEFNRIDSPRCTSQHVTLLPSFIPTRRISLEIFVSCSTRSLMAIGALKFITNKTYQGTLQSIRVCYSIVLVRLQLESSTIYRCGYCQKAS